MGTSRPSEYDTIFELAAQWPNSSIRALKKFVFDYVAKMDRLSDRLDQGEQVHITMTIIFDIPNELVQAFSKEVKRLGRKQRR